MVAYRPILCRKVKKQTKIQPYFYHLSNVRSVGRSIHVVYRFLFIYFQFEVCIALKCAAAHCRILYANYKALEIPYKENTAAAMHRI